MKSFASLPRLAVALILSLAAITTAHAQTFSVLHSFGGTATDGTTPYSNLVLDEEGNLYGTTEYGVAAPEGVGTIFEIDSSGNETVLHAFIGPDGDGARPYGPIVRMGGSLYGTTMEGSTNRTCTIHGGCGTIFRLTRGKLTILHSFTSSEGGGPAGVTKDSSGNLFGATTYGGIGTPTAACGSQGCGTIFEYSQGHESVLYSFLGQPDGNIPNGELLVDGAGNIYGTTESGGTFNHGTVFELSPGSGGTWTETALYSFRGESDGTEPLGGVILDAKGNLYGTTQLGGLRIDCNGTRRKNGCGVVYKLARNTDGTWSERVLHRFEGSAANDGYLPMGSLVRDQHGNLYGTTIWAGTQGYGGIFEIDLNGDEKLLHILSGDKTEGMWPNARLTMDAAGNIYGTATYGGADSVFGGTVFKITP